MIIVSDIWLACDIALPCIFGCAQLTVQISENGAQTVDKIFFFSQYGSYKPANAV